MKKLIAIVLIMTSMVGFCHGHHNFIQIHRPPIHHCHKTHHRHRIGQAIVCTVIGATVGTIISNILVNRVWIPEKRIISGCDVYHRPIYIIIPGHWEYR